MATEVAPDSIPDELDFLDGMDDDWMAFLAKDSSEELDLDNLFDDPAVTGSPNSGLTHASPSKDEEGAGSGTERSEDGSKKSSEGNSISRTTSKRLGKRKGGEHEEERQEEGVVDEDEVKRRARLMRNRESAQLSRQRKKAYVDDLEERVRTLNATVAELNNTVNLISAENVSLRNQLAYFYSNGAANGAPVKPVPYAPPVGVPMYPYTAGGYVMRPGATAPPVPIPRLKTPATTVRNAKRARVDGKTGTGRTKKLASLAAFGFFCIMFLVFPLDLGIPRVSQVPWSSDSGVQTAGSSSARIGGRVLMSWDSDSSQLDWRPSDGGETDGYRIGYGDYENRAVIDGSTFPANVSYGGNFSHRFPASIWLPRENKVLKLDGDLIIQAVLAGNEAAVGVENKTEIAYPPALLNSGAFQDIAARALRTSQPLRALPSSATVNALPSADDAEGPQRKILSDLAGTVFSTGMCTEAFQFELSDTEAETSVEASRTSGRLKRSGHHRRNLGTVPLSSGKVELKRKKENVTDLAAEKRPSSMVVSVFNPAQAGASAKDLARIFVVVLIDSVKYVTYSCMLPQVVSG